MSYAHFAIQSKIRQAVFGQGCDVGWYGRILGLEDKDDGKVCDLRFEE
jgi:hypothetical protein